MILSATEPTVTASISSDRAVHSYHNSEIFTGLPLNFIFSSLVKKMLDMLAFSRLLGTILFVNTCTDTTPKTIVAHKACSYSSNMCPAVDGLPK